MTNQPHTVNDFVLSRQIVKKLLDAHRPPYRLSINHNVGPPQNLACPLHYDWRYGKTVGVIEKLPAMAGEWIMMALARGYRVARLDNRRGFEEVYSDSLKSARQREAFRVRRAAMTPEQRERDDEIPF